MFVAGIFVDYHLAPKPIYQKASSLKLQKKLLPLPGEGGFSGKWLWNIAPSLTLPLREGTYCEILKMFVLGIFVDNQLAPQAHLSEGKLPTNSRKTPSPTKGRWILRQMTEKTEGVPANGSGIRSPP